MLNISKFKEATALATQRDEFSELLEKELLQSTRVSKERQTIHAIIQALQLTEAQEWDQLEEPAEVENQELFDQIVQKIILNIGTQIKLLEQMRKSLSSDVAQEN